MKSSQVLILDCILTLIVLGMAAVANCETPATPPCDPLLAPCAYIEGWVITERHWSPGAETRDLVGGRIQAEVRYHSWRWSVRGDSTGIPGEYQQGKLETVRSIEVHAAASYDALRLPGGALIGPAIGLGAAVGLDQDKAGERADMPKRFTAGIGLRVSSPQGWCYAVVGQHQALRGIAAVLVWQIKGSDRVASVGSFAVGSRTWVATTGAAVRFR
jgi:hypothetical protein